MPNLYQILVPTKYGDNEKPISTKHHKEWDRKVLQIIGGLTILPKSKGKWLHKEKTYIEGVIPVLLSCTEKQKDKIIKMTLGHYRQIAVMYYLVSDKCFIVYKE